DLERFVVEHDLSADDARVAAEAFLPEAVFEDGDLRASGFVLAPPESAAELRPDAERVEEGRRHAITRVTLGRPFAGQGEIAVAHHDDLLERRGLRAPLDHVARRDRAARDASVRVALEEDHQPRL